MTGKSSRTLVIRRSGAGGKKQWCCSADEPNHHWAPSMLGHRQNKGENFNLDFKSLLEIASFLGIYGHSRFERLLKQFRSKSSLKRDQEPLCREWDPRPRLQHRAPFENTMGWPGTTPDPVACGTFGCASSTAAVPQRESWCHGRNWHRRAACI